MGRAYVVDQLSPELRILITCWYRTKKVGLY